MVGNLAHGLVEDDNYSYEILDLYLAPGSKTVHLAEIKNSKVLACDISISRLENKKKMLEKLNLSIIVDILLNN